MARDETRQNDQIPVRIPLVREPTGVLKSWQLMRENVLNIIPEAATHEPAISGRTAKRWHMIMDPDAIQKILAPAA